MKPLDHVNFSREGEPADTHCVAMHQQSEMRDGLRSRALRAALMVSAAFLGGGLLGLVAVMGALLYQSDPSPGPARAMTREDLTCDLPNHTITLRPAAYSDYPGRAVELCGWTIDDMQPNVTFSGTVNAPVSRKESLDHAQTQGETCWQHNSDPFMSCEPTIMPDPGVAR